MTRLPNKVVLTRLSMNELNIEFELCRIAALTVCSASVIMALGMVRASRILHEGLLKTTLHTPMSFMDVTPLGRILNRFGKVRVFIVVVYEFEGDRGGEKSGEVLFSNSRHALQKTLQSMGRSICNLKCIELTMRRKGSLQNGKGYTN